MPAPHSPQKNSLAITFDLIYQAVANKVNHIYREMFGPSFAQLKIAAPGYGGQVEKTYTPQNSILTNPWGVAAQFGYTGTAGRVTLGNLTPGQSIDLNTGRLSDPKLHPDTANLLNRAVQQRAVNEAGLSQASQTSARESQSVLAQLDQLYFGSQLASPTSDSAPLSQLAQANQTGFNSSGTKTVLGTQTKKKPLPSRPSAVIART